MAARPRAAGTLGAGRGGHARQDHHDLDAGVDPRRRGPRARLPDRRRAAELRRLGAADRQRVLRDRGRRIRHRLLRQALEVRPLPAAHGDPEQPRIRPRRHLSRPRGDRDAVPPSGAHRAAQRPPRRQRREEPRWSACWRAAAGARSSASAPRKRRRTGARLDDRRRRQRPARRCRAGCAGNST